MKVLMLTQTYPRFAGDTAGTFIESIARTLVASGDSVHVLLPHDALLDLRRDTGGVTLTSFRYAPSAGLHVLGYSRTMQADVGLKPLAYALSPLFMLAAGRALRRLVREGRPDVVNAHWLVPNGVVAAAVKRRPLVVSLHGSDVAMAEKRLYRRASAWALARTEVLTGSSQDLVDRAVAVGAVADARFIPYGVDPQRFDGHDARAAELRHMLGIPSDAAMILGVGRMVPKKGFDVLLDALAGLERRGWVMVLAGAGDSLAELRARARSLGLEGLVRFPGSVRHDELGAYYSAADIFVMPSVRDHSGNVDGLPNVVLEAMASARAIVATRVGGMPAVIDNGVGGLLVGERSVEGLAAALRQLLAKPGERHALGEEARRRVLRELTWKHVAARYREAYVAAMAHAQEGRAGAGARD